MYKQTDPGFFSFIIMVFIACSVVWWNGWDRLALDKINGVVKTGTDAKTNVMKQVDGVKDIMKKRDQEVYDAIDEPRTAAPKTN
jgi:hypothetical protein